MELKARDLRVGNWLRFDNMISEPYNYQVSPRMFRQMGYDVSENLDLKINNYHKPIPITEDILLKCGFEKDGIGFWYRKNPNVKSRDIWGGWYLNKEGELTVTLGIIHKRIYWLHELQNLIFALTKTELTINL